jgi:hypothetical protein
MMLRAAEGGLRASRSFSISPSAAKNLNSRREQH